jgi:hypothetical protein
MKPVTPAPGTLLVEAMVETEMRVPEGVTEVTLQSDTGFIAAAETSLAESLGVDVDDVGVSWVAMSASKQGRSRLLQQASSSGKTSVTVQTGYAIRAGSGDEIKTIGQKMRNPATMRSFRNKAAQNLGGGDFEMGEGEPRVLEVSEFTATDADTDDAALPLSASEPTPATANSAATNNVLLALALATGLSLLF